MLTVLQRLSGPHHGGNVEGQTIESEEVVVVAAHDEDSMSIVTHNEDLFETGTEDEDLDNHGIGVSHPSNTNIGSVSEYSDSPDESPPTLLASLASSLPSPHSMLKTPPPEKKRMLAQHDSPPSPLEKHSRPKVVSNICKALEDAQAVPKKGLLSFFSKATEEEKIAYQMKTTDEEKEQIELDEYNARQAGMQQKIREREQSRVWQQRRRDRMKKIDIMNGTRSPGGRKRMTVR